MTVREFLSMGANNIYIEIYQTPIKKIDKCNNLVCRQTGSISVLLDSNQNYLDFEIEYLMENNGLITIVCTANEEQEQKIIDGHKGA